MLPSLPGQYHHSKLHTNLSLLSVPMLPALLAATAWFTGLTPQLASQFEGYVKDPDLRTQLGRVVASRGVGTLHLQLQVGGEHQHQPLPLPPPLLSHHSATPWDACLGVTCPPHTPLLQPTLDLLNSDPCV
jgi:hypothetical protein